MIDEALQTRAKNAIVNYLERRGYQFLSEIARNEVAWGMFCDGDDILITSMRIVEDDLSSGRPSRKDAEIAASRLLGGKSKLDNITGCVHLGDCVLRQTGAYNALLRFNENAWQFGSDLREEEETHELKYARHMNDDPDTANELFDFLFQYASDWTDSHDVDPDRVMSELFMRFSAYISDTYIY